MIKNLIAILLLTAQISYAQIPKPAKNTYINDYAGVLTNDQITNLNRSIAAIEKAQAVQLAVILVNKVPSAYDIQDFAVLIGKKWHVGKNKKGIVYVAAIDQHAQRIEVARNLDDILPSAKCTAIMDGMKTSFRAKDYNGGLEILVNQIASSLNINVPATQQAQAAAPVSAPVQDAANAAKDTSNDSTNTLIGFLFIAGIVILVVVYLRYKNKKRKAMQDFYNGRNGNNPGYFNPGQGGANMGYGNPGYGMPGYGMPPQQDHTLRNIAAGAIGGAVAGYAARSIQDGLSQPDYNRDYNNNDRNNYNTNPDSSSSNESSSWGNWGDSGGSDSSSSDSGFSDDSSSDSSSSSGATSDW